MPPPRAVTGARPPSRDSSVPGTRLACGVTPGTRSLEPRPGGDVREVARGRPGVSETPRPCSGALRSLRDRGGACRRRRSPARRVLGVGSWPFARATEARRAGQGHAP